MGKYIAFLRGINVGGHHKVPMADLRKELETLGFENVVTILNSGNIIFDAGTEKVENLGELISNHLQSAFNFPVPAITRKAEDILQLFERDPFRDTEVTKDIRLYVSFLKNPRQPEFEIPWTSPDGSYRIIEAADTIILSILDLSISNTPAAMDIMEKSYGKDITTRNWKTIERIVKKI